MVFEGFENLLETFPYDVPDDKLQEAACSDALSIALQSDAGPVTDCADDMFMKFGECLGDANIVRALQEDTCQMLLPHSKGKDRSTEVHVKSLDVD